MTSTYTKEELRMLYNELPDEVKDAIFSPETSDAFDAIQKTYELDALQREVLSTQSGLVMMGLLPPEMFVNVLIEKLNVKRDKASFIAQAVNRDIFNSIKNYLVILHGVTKKGEKNENPKAGLAPAPLPPKPTPVASAPTPKAPDVPVIPKAPNQPVRSEWGWHGKKNETTGKIEFQHESSLPPALQSLGTQTGSGETKPLGDAHVGSVFEQKLGGIFRVKGDTTEYQGSATPVERPTEEPLAPLHVPMKPVQAVVPPVRPFQPPKS